MKGIMGIMGLVPLFLNVVATMFLRGFFMNYRNIHEYEAVILVKYSCWERSVLHAQIAVRGYYVII